MRDLALEEGDLAIRNGDFDLVEGIDEELQRVEMLLLSNKGEWKEHPQMGANILEYMKAKDGKQELTRAVRLNLQADGLDYNKLKGHIRYL